MAWTTDDKTGVTQIGILGNSAEAGPFVTRLRFPAGHRNAAHAHSTRYEGTVLSGTLHLRLVTGDQTVVLPAGSFVTVPAGLVHEEWTVDGVELEMRGEGPLMTTPVK
jgi:quercetin dioxygenase-like cupin family protein